MERMIGMLNLMSAIILLAAAAYMHVAFDVFLSGLIRSVIGGTVLVYFLLSLSRIVLGWAGTEALVPRSQP